MSDGQASPSHAVLAPRSRGADLAHPSLHAHSLSSRHGHPHKALIWCPVADDPPRLLLKAFPKTYTNCGIENTLQAIPEKIVTMNQGSLEFLLGMGLEDRIVGTRGVPPGLDPIWPKYKDAYNNLPVMTGADGNSYPSEAEVTAANADFIFADWRSAFSEYAWNNDTNRQWTFVGECGGENSDFWPTGENTTYIDKGRGPGFELKGEIESHCRPQLHANGIGTFLSAVSCEDATLRSPPTQQTLYDTITTMGEIFNVPIVASQLITEIQSDFVIAQQTLQEGAGHSLTAVWLDCISCCQDEPERSFFVGAGGGAPQMIMKEAGFTNLFADRDNSWACVTVADIIAAEPDVMIVVEAGFDPALDKIGALLPCTRPTLHTLLLPYLPPHARTPPVFPGCLMQSSCTTTPSSVTRTTSRTPTTSSSRSALRPLARVSAPPPSTWSGRPSR